MKIIYERRLIMIVFEIEQGDKIYFKEFENKYPESVEIVASDSLIGVNDVIQIVIVLGPITLPFITKVAIELIKDRKKATIKWNGSEITGLTEKNAVEIFDKMLRYEEKKNVDSGDIEGNKENN